VNPTFGRFHHVAHLAVNDAADDEVAAAFVRQFAVFLFHGPRGLMPHAHFAVQLFFRKQSGIEPVVQVVAVISDFVGEIGNLGFERRAFGFELVASSGVVVAGFVFGQPLAHLPGEVEAGESRILLFQLLDHAQALAIVLETAEVLHQFVQHDLAFVSERRVAEVVRQRDRLGEVLIQFQRAGDVARNGRDLHGVCEARAQVVAGAVQKDLRLVFQPAKGARMNDPISVALVVRPPVGRVFGIPAPPGIGAELGVRREILAFQLFQFLACARHDSLRC